LIYSNCRSNESRKFLKGLFGNPFKNFLDLGLNAKRCKNQLKSSVGEKVELQFSMGLIPLDSKTSLNFYPQ
jgi:hypothetical protein